MCLSLSGNYFDVELRQEEEDQTIRARPGGIAEPCECCSYGLIDSKCWNIVGTTDEQTNDCNLAYVETDTPHPPSLLSSCGWLSLQCDSGGNIYTARERQGQSVSQLGMRMN